MLKRAEQIFWRAFAGSTGHQAGDAILVFYASVLVLVAILMPDILSRDLHRTDRLILLGGVGGSTLLLVLGYFFNPPQNPKRS